MSLFDAAAHSPSAPAFVFAERIVTFGEVAAWARRLAAAMPSDDAVAAFVARPDEPSLVFAAAMVVAGRAIFPLHPRSTEAELRDSIAGLAGARRIDPREALDRALREPDAPADAPDDDERLLAAIESSGTSSAPKAVLLSRRAFAASARASAAHLGFVDGDRWLLAMPFSHAGGLSIVTRCLAAGRPVVVHDRFDPDRVVESIDREGVTMLSAVPSMLVSLLEADRANRLSSLRVVLLGGAACPPSLYETAVARGVTVVTTYGLTEACSQVTTQRLSDPASRTARDVGFPLPGASVRIVDASKRIVVGIEGDIEIAGDTLFSGYAGREPRARGAFFSTGDRGTLDEEGRLVVSGRADDLIVTGGENVSPRAVEDALRASPGVREAFVVAVPDDRWGAVVGALVVLSGTMSLDAVLHDTEARLAPHKRPRRALAVDAIPLARTGKPDRAAARAWLELAPQERRSKS